MQYHIALQATDASSVLHQQPKSVGDQAKIKRLNRMHLRHQVRSQINVCHMARRIEMSVRALERAEDVGRAVLVVDLVRV